MDLKMEVGDAFYDVTIDYGITIRKILDEIELVRQRISGMKLFNIHDSIYAFDYNMTGVYDVRLKLVKLDETTMRTNYKVKDVIENMKKFEFEPANFEHLIAFSKKHTREFRTQMIAAPGRSMSFKSKRKFSKEMSEKGYPMLWIGPTDDTCLFYEFNLHMINEEVRVPGHFSYLVIVKQNRIT